MARLVAVIPDRYVAIVGFLAALTGLSLEITRLHALATDAPSTWPVLPT